MIRNKLMNSPGWSAELLWTNQKLHKSVLDLEPYNQDAGNLQKQKSESKSNTSKSALKSAYN